ncbi:hypothetical protein A3B40_02710 [Candidatus Roizmanbacteria bacterium RIFCSPLOWO2_01_FULL_37_16]|uniref:ABC transmembrane type-1 domain-containing protein n=1 Tax=Candidatus Roizmanbacteria bacterium RIFCSPLOWO2_01_FULL_37_16 TaxID=1802058 RepID=A0A1F7IM03_9BACT|nr:MAG: hypothetical protein A3F57_06095 [Candidatus Roizmanbacteria bacterium RIFCSPHIGHO2_12_FULL_36_11]OGK44421.1 MAG: hypothetical protein A3B40_02710 [Candidatus Roizmanbacteria bacterium RIFCSPLOWO2_01_FULL_37_16]
MFDFMLTNLEIRALINSIVISLGVSFLSILLSFFLAVSLSFSRIPLKRLFSLLFLIPLLIPPYLHVFSWMHLLMFMGDYNLFGITSNLGIQILSSIPGVIFVLTLAYFPISFFIIHQAIDNIPLELIDAATLVARPVKILRHIIIPAVLPATLTAAISTFIVAFITFDVPAFLGKNVFITQIFKSFTFTGEITRALYLSSIPVLIVGSSWALLLLFLVRNRPFFSLQSLPKDKPYSIKQSPALTMLIFLIFVVLSLFSSVLPLGVIQLKNLLYEGVPLYTASSRGVIANTLWISIISSVFIVLFSSFIYLIIYRKRLGRIIFLSLLALPPITFGILFIYLFNRPAFTGIYATPIILIIAYSFRFTPLVCELLYTYSQQINPQYFESARLVYSPSWRKPRQTWRILNKIALPLYTPALFIAWMFSFWLVATELPITLLIQPPGFQTIITRLFIVLHYGAEELMSPMTFALLSVSLLPILAVYLFFRLGKKYGQ